jgi:hypothetical protein
MVAFVARSSEEKLLFLPFFILTILFLHSSLASLNKLTYLSATDLSAGYILFPTNKLICFNFEIPVQRMIVRLAKTKITKPVSFTIPTTSSCWKLGSDR